MQHKKTEAQRRAEAKERNAKVVKRVEGKGVLRYAKDKK
jgi:hypothetical protein